MIQNYSSLDVTFKGGNEGFRFTLLELLDIYGKESSHRSNKFKQKQGSSSYLITRSKDASSGLFPINCRPMQE